ncbi:glutathione S-transferase family protein [Bradyrhizobium prioriisuperbiae]|uniref:glutathione S-transferase family protein n=1 Tax=Bradyrhizobium prioriisuperbiae TaxID=2854389 RepID=UPI0028ED98EE|nr:glutathione S-transferase family protein [Bradyrhizobium prioritasuperba]
MLRLLGRTSSINVRKVLWTLAELNVPFDHEADWATPERPATSPEFLALNPNGLVPVLIDAHGVLTESNTICRYLAARHSRTDLLPRAPEQRARIEMWMDWQATELNPAWRAAFLGLVRRDPAFDPAAIEASSTAWSAKMHILDRQLATTQAYVAGDMFTVADIVLGLSVHRYFATPLAHAALPAVRGYVTRLNERDGFRRLASAQYP